MGRAAVQQAHHHLLAIATRQGADPEIHFAAAEHAADPAVLGQAPLGDVQIGHDLEAGGDCRCEPLRECFNMLPQYAIDAEADVQGMVLGFDVNVAGAGGEGFDQDPIH